MPDKGLTAMIVMRVYKDVCKSMNADMNEECKQRVTGQGTQLPTKYVDPHGVHSWLSCQAVQHHVGLLRQGHKSVKRRQIICDEAKAMRIGDIYPYHMMYD
jgi:hypothetical protein